MLGTKDALDKLLTTSPGLSEKSGVIIDEVWFFVLFILFEVFLFCFIYHSRG